MTKQIVLIWNRGLIGLRMTVSDKYIHTETVE